MKPYALFPLKDQSEKSEKNLSRFAVADVESRQWINHLMTGFFDGTEYCYFTKLGSFLDHCFDKYIGWDIFAHFGGKFDFLFFLSEILKNEKYKIKEMVPRGSGFLCITVTCRDRVITFRDSSAILPFSLAKITKAFGVEHKKQEFDFSTLEKVTPELIEYNEYDCRGLYESIKKFYESEIIKKAGPGITIASQAIRVFRTYLEKPVFSLSRNLDQKIRSAYLGGRVEIFRPFFKSTERSSLYNYDVNSLYPTVMLQNTYPNKFKYRTYQYEAKKHGFYECQFTVPEDMWCPPIGVVRNGKYVFPTGTFRTIATTHEINYAKSLGIKCKTSAGWIFSNGGYLFKEFITDLYRIKEQSPEDSVNYFVAKNLMNNCYGKMAQRNDRENIVFDDGSCGLKFLRDLKVGKINYRLMTKEVELESFNNVAIAAYVTAYARIFMHKNFYAPCGRDLYYTDTDSIFTTKKFKTSTKLGGLKLVDTIPGDQGACFLLPKTYIAGKKIVMKGFDKKKIKHFTIEDFYQGLEGELKALKITEEPKFATFKTAIRNNEILTMTKGSTRQIRSAYDKRIIFKNSKGDFESRPIHLWPKQLDGESENSHGSTTTTS